MRKLFVHRKLNHFYVNDCLYILYTPFLKSTSSPFEYLHSIFLFWPPRCKNDIAWYNARDEGRAVIYIIYIIKFLAIYSGFKFIFFLKMMHISRGGNGEVGQPQQFLVRATLSLISRPSHLESLILPYFFLV